MIVGIDGSSILPQRTGVGQYTYHLMRALAETDGDEQFRVFLNSFRHPLPADAAFLRGGRFKTRHLRLPGPMIVNAWRRFGAPSIDRLVGRCDVFHSPATYVPPQTHGARVTTVHDLYFMRHPEECHSLGGRYLLDHLPRVAPTLDRVIAVSHATAGDIVELYGVDPERISIIHEGVDARFRPVPDDEARRAALKRYGVPSEYILSVATLEPRKNLPALLCAYAGLRESTLSAPPLVLVGGFGWMADAIHKTVTDLELTDDVIFTGYVANEDLPAIYSAASVFAFVSLYEGFGLPLLEAMACGTPTVTSNTSSLVEVAGDASLTIDPTDVEAITHALATTLEDAQTRRTLIDRGIARAAQFSWERCAEETLAVYREVTR